MITALAEDRFRVRILRLAWKRLTTFEDQRARVRERLVLELQRSLDNFDRQYSHIPISKVIVACYPAIESILDDLAESTYVPVFAMNLAEVLDFPSVPELRKSDCQAQNLLAIGAALRTGGGAA